MSHRQLVLVAIDHATDVERIVTLARRIAAARDAEVRVVDVVAHRAAYRDDRPGARRVTRRGVPAHVIPAYAQLHGATLLVVERDFGSSRLWRHSGVVQELSRRSPVPLLVLPKHLPRTRDARRLHRILTPIDFSMASAVALRAALDLSSRHDASLTLLHALHELPQHMVFSGSEALELARRLPAHTAAIEARLRRYAATFSAEPIDTEVGTGVADDAILDAIARREADLVVIGVARRSWLDRLLFGSTLRGLLRRTTVPLLVVPVAGGTQAWTAEPMRDRLTIDGWVVAPERHAA